MNQTGSASLGSVNGPFTPNTNEGAKLMTANGLFVINTGSSNQNIFVEQQ
jgi:hypothetical protein